jgi:pilus assembly protein CpaB
MGQTFGGHTGNPRTRNRRHIRVLVIAAFVCVTVLAVGLPLLSKPASVAPVPLPQEKPKLVVPALPTSIPMVDIFMPQQRVNIGTQLNISMFKKERVNEIALSTLGGKALRTELEFVGKYARTLIVPGRPIMADQVMDSPDNIITRKIRPGFRAITVEVNNVTGIEGWGLPGTRVDVLWVSAATGEQSVTTIVKAAEILSVAGQTKVNPRKDKEGSGEGFGQAPQGEGGGGGNMPSKSVWTVTLLITPEDGQKIFLASRSGELSLMLRGDFEAGVEVQPQTFTTRTLIAGASRDHGEEKVEGLAKARREDGSYEEWSVIEGRVWRWNQPNNGELGGGQPPQ